MLSFTPQAVGSRLTEAERDVALAVIRGLSNAEIARARHASVRTIANQMAALMKKLEVASRVELAARFDVLDFV
jgi:DNA-binding NarL/FixJ family response regulator